MQCCALVQGWDKFTSSASLEKQWKASALIREQRPVGGATRGTVPGRAWGLGFTDPRELWAQVAAAAMTLLQSCPTLCNPIDGSPQALLSLGFSRQELWSGLPFPSPVHESEK